MKVYRAADYASSLFSFSLPVRIDVVYAALQILYPRFLAVQNFVRFVCFFLCEKQVPHILLQLLVGLGITSKKATSTAKETEKHSHAYAVLLGLSACCCHTLVFYSLKPKRNESHFIPSTHMVLRAYFIKKFSFARSVYAHCFIYFLSLFYIYQPKRFADRNVFLSSSFPSAFLR